MPQIEDVIVNQYFGFSEFLQKRLHGFYWFGNCEDGQHRGKYLTRISRPNSTLGRILSFVIDIFAEGDAAVYCTSLGQQYILKLYNQDELEQFADLALEYEELYPGRIVSIQQFANTKK